MIRTADQIEAAVAYLFETRDTTLGIPGQLDTIRLRGRLLVPSEQAYPQIAASLREMGYTALLRRDDDGDLDVLLAVPGVMPQESGSRLWVNALLYVLTILTTLYAGVYLSDQVPFDADLAWIVTHLWLGWPFALSLMTILTGHELGHYFSGRYYRVPVSLPYFIPLPVPPLGTMGAFIMMKGRSVNRRQMLTVGAAGPLVGFVLAVPILLLGLSLSTITPMNAGEGIMMEGNSLLYLLFKYIVFGQVLPGSGDPASIMATLKEIGAALLAFFPVDSGYDVFVHPVAFAGWAGLLVTALNLLPVGQLDGGHVLYSLVGQKARVLTWPLIGLLLVMGIFLWQGWLLWAFMLFFFGRSHPDPLDDVTRLDAPRIIVAVCVLLIFVLTFTPVPLQMIFPDTPAQPSGPESSCLATVGLVAAASFAFVRWNRARPRAGTSEGGQDG